jgi:hypothetical protein
MHRIRIEYAAVYTQPLASNHIIQSDEPMQQGISYFGHSDWYFYPKGKEEEK